MCVATFPPPSFAPAAHHRSSFIAKLNFSRLSLRLASPACNDIWAVGRTGQGGARQERDQKQHPRPHHHHRTPSHAHTRTQTHTTHTGATGSSFTCREVFLLTPPTADFQQPAVCRNSCATNRGTVA